MTALKMLFWPSTHTLFLQYQMSICPNSPYRICCTIQTSPKAPPRPAPPQPSTRELADLDGVGMALQAKTSQAFARILIGQVEVALQVFRCRFLHVQLISILLVEEPNFLQGGRKRKYMFTYWWYPGLIILCTIPILLMKGAELVVQGYNPWGSSFIASVIFPLQSRLWTMPGWTMIRLHPS